MSTYYSIFAKVQVTNEEEAVRALKEKVEHPSEKTFYNVNGEIPETLEGLMKILLAAHQGSFDCEHEGNEYTFSSCFNATYSWENVMTDWFESICPYLANESYMEISTDYDNYYAVSVDGGMIMKPSL